MRSSVRSKFPVTRTGETPIGTPMNWNEQPHWTHRIVNSAENDTATFAGREAEDVALRLEFFVCATH
jgi:hypothetical protein